MKEGEAPMEGEETLEVQIIGVAYERRTPTKIKIVGTKASHPVIIIKGSGICRKVVVYKINNMYDL